MGVCIIEAWSESERVKAATGAPYWGNLRKMERDMAAPNPPLPKLKVPKWDDAGKARKVGEIVAERVTAAGKELAKLPGADKFRAEVGKSHLPGRVTLATQGHWLVTQAGEAEKSQRGQMPLPEATLTLTADHWRAYSRVRTCRPERSNRISWSFGPSGLAFSTNDREMAEASEMVPGMCAVTGRVDLDDSYLWPLRGVNWAMGVTTGGDAVCLLSAEYAVLVMGMR